MPIFDAATKISMHEVVQQMHSSEDEQDEPDQQSLSKANSW